MRLSQDRATSLSDISFPNYEIHHLGHANHRHQSLNSLPLAQELPFAEAKSRRDIIPYLLEIPRSSTLCFLIIHAFFFNIEARGHRDDQK